MQDDAPAEFAVDQDPIAQTLLPEALEDGILIPLKTTLELRDDHTCTTVLITRAPVKSANSLITCVSGQQAHAGSIG
jgi:tRNA-specific adenosine deaminase 3